MQDSRFSESKIVEKQRLVGSQERDWSLLEQAPFELHTHS